MTRSKLLLRPAGLTLGLIALSATTGCAHFREAHERVLREQGQEQSAATPIPTPTQAPAPRPAPVAVPQAAPVAAPVRSAAPVKDVPAPAESRKDEKAAIKARKEQDKAARQALRQDSKAQAHRPAPAMPQTPAPVTAPEPARPEAAAPQQTEPLRQPVFDTTAAPEPSPGKAADAAVATVPAAVPGSPSAIVIFSNVPGTHCGDCETLRISVAPSGKILIERGHGAEESWRYRRSVAHVRPDRAKAFLARVAAVRPMGRETLAAGPACPAGARDDALAIEWIEAERHDELTVPLSCGARREDSAISALLHAPDLLGLRQLVFPWNTAR
ncbi:MAG: hypothetical protein KGJ57_22025 [Sphingomonadales bacterium]|nr:hypothetical protein [Sphingomonadales bacterium]MDE2172068.1 hypothetical protein [Sphingomonadales bacterium]